MAPGLMNKGSSSWLLMCWKAPWGEALWVPEQNVGAGPRQRTPAHLGKIISRVLYSWGHRLTNKGAPSVSH